MKADNGVQVSASTLSEISLEGQCVAVVGGTGGIGREIARVLAQRGARVIVVGRTFRDENLSGVEFMKADLSLVSEASRVAKLLPSDKLDLLIFTTGIFSAPTRKETSEGLEEDIAISYYSRLVILSHVAPKLQKHGGKNARVFIMGYPGDGQLGHADDLNSEESYGVFYTHMNTVACNEALVHYLRDKYSNVNFYGLNPGIIKSTIRDNYLGKDSWKSRIVEWLVRMTNQTAEQYAQKLVPIIVSPDLDSHNGILFDKNGSPIQRSDGFTDEHAEKLVEASQKLLVDKGLEI